MLVKKRQAAHLTLRVCEMLIQRSTKPKRRQKVVRHGLTLSFVLHDVLYNVLHDLLYDVVYDTKTLESVFSERSVSTWISPRRERECGRTR